MSEPTKSVRWICDREHEHPSRQTARDCNAKPRLYVSFSEWRRLYATDSRLDVAKQIIMPYSETNKPIEDTLFSLGYDK